MEPGLQELGWKERKEGSEGHEGRLGESLNL
jgi:hypothetical protein